MQNNQDDVTKKDNKKPLKDKVPFRKEGSLVKLGEIYDLRQMIKDKGFKLKD